MADRVGFIGLGAIGRPIARHVAGRFDTVVWNRTAARAQEFSQSAGARVAESPAALVSQVDVVMTCLPTSREVWEVTEAAGKAWRAGQLLIDVTSGDPITSRELARQMAARKVGFVDAPVSGGTSGAEAGKLTVMVGGEEQWVTRARPTIFDIFQITGIRNDSRDYFFHHRIIQPIRYNLRKGELWKSFHPQLLRNTRNFMQGTSNAPKQKAMCWRR